MADSVAVTGFWGDAGRPEPIPASLTVSGSAGSETLTIACAGVRVGVPFRQLERLAADARSDPAGAAGVERHAVVNVYIFRGDSRLASAAIDIWFRRKAAFEMLSLALGGGQLSLPYAPVADLVRLQRRNTV